ncbi:uncharacterized protein VTP21DRAFT_3856 [Calcarisporiella thermophila]|uniref:uncharacterized protein n=1 Tax=Calcarisporiella thermophila TaxID=911321 RepID=UPI003744A676
MPVKTALIPRSPLTAIEEEPISDDDWPTIEPNGRPRTALQRLADFLANTGPELSEASPPPQPPPPIRPGKEKKKKISFFSRNKKPFSTPMMQSTTSVQTTKTTATASTTTSQKSNGKKYVAIVVDYTRDDLLATSITRSNTKASTGTTRSRASSVAETIETASIRSWRPPAGETAVSNSKLNLMTEVRGAGWPTPPQSPATPTLPPMKPPIDPTSPPASDKLAKSYTQAQTQTNAPFQPKPYDAADMSVFKLAQSFLRAEQGAKPDVIEFALKERLKNMPQIIGDEHTKLLEAQVIGEEVLGELKGEKRRRRNGVRHVQIQTQEDLGWTTKRSICTQTTNNGMADEKPERTDKGVESQNAVGNGHGKGDSEETVSSLRAQVQALTRELEETRRALAAEKRSKSRWIAAANATRAHFDRLSGDAYLKIRELASEKDVFAQQIRDLTKSLERVVQAPNGTANSKRMSYLKWG